MNLDRPSAGPRTPPAEFDELIDWYDRFSIQLVLLEEYSRNDVHVAVQRLVEAVRQHGRAFDASLGTASGLAPERRAAGSLLRSGHRWFEVSLEQLEWLYGIVEGEDHGGHRQALGQYGQVLAESLRRHREDERAYLAAPTGSAEEGVR